VIPIVGEPLPFHRTPSRPRTRISLSTRTREMLLIVGGFAALVGPFLLYVWAHVQIVSTGYRIEATEQRLKALEQENRALRLRRARLESLAAVDARARDLGLAPPDPARLVVVRAPGAAPRRLPPPLPSPSPSPSPAPASEARR